MSKHYVDSVATNTLSEGVQETPMADRQTSQYTNCPWTLCLYTDPEGWECVVPINCGTAPDHFKDTHDIANLARDVELVSTGKVPMVCIYVAWRKCLGLGDNRRLSGPKPGPSGRAELSASSGHRVRGVGQTLALLVAFAGLLEGVEGGCKESTSTGRGTQLSLKARSSLPDASFVDMPKRTKARTEPGLMEGSNDHVRNTCI
ncbi:hypothetical protein EDC04DRAFT_2608141 [Pisolithus marmoratus]|nr:hypothetical protein EDC04DRAFT_2608141 [Pisolithus marmoratus]